MGSVTEDSNNFAIRPNLSEKFRTTEVKELIHATLVEHLSGFVYTPEAAEQMTTSMAEFIRNKLLNLSLPRYKYVVNILMGEQRGEGVKFGARCIWDSDADNYASDIFLTDTFFCSAVVFGIYFY